MRLCLELGLHRPKPYQSHRSRSEQQRRELFWSVYVFERKSALVLGRPFAISDKDIVISLPDDESQQDGSIGSKSSTALLRNHVLIYRIHSKIRSTLHHLRSETPSAKLADKVSSCLRKLEDWKSRMLREIGSQNVDTSSTSRPTPIHSHGDSSDSAEDEPVLLQRSPGQDKAELLLEYHKARRSLLQPLLTDGGSQYSPTLADYSACADASGQICRHYRLLHRLSAMPFTLRDLHAVLIAGFTWLHCIAARPILYNAHNASAIGACSTVLYLIAEQWSGAKKYRDTFEIVADKLIAKWSHQTNRVSLWGPRAMQSHVPTAVCKAMGCTPGSATPPHLPGAPPYHWYKRVIPRTQAQLSYTESWRPLETHQLWMEVVNTISPICLVTLSRNPSQASTWTTLTIVFASCWQTKASIGFRKNDNGNT
jgi:hypothetical protein